MRKLTGYIVVWDNSHKNPATFCKTIEQAIERINELINKGTKEKNIKVGMENSKSIPNIY